MSAFLALGVPVAVMLLLQRLRLTLRAERWQTRRRRILLDRVQRGREDACWAAHRTHTDAESPSDVSVARPERREALSAS